MIHSPTCEHALRALIYMAWKDKGGPQLVREIAEGADVPRQSMAKILHGLKRSGLVASVKGPGGGYTFAKPANQITLREVVESVDGRFNLSGECILGLDNCSDENSCPLHTYWKGFRTRYVETIDTLTLHEAAKTLDRKRHVKNIGK